MRQPFSILIIVILFVGALVVLNALSYRPVEHKPDTEDTPDRSTLNAGASGTKALFEFFSEGGYNVERWRDPIENLKKSGQERPSTFVIIGPTLKEVTPDESSQVLSWVADGNTLVLIDREPESGLTRVGDNWRLEIEPSDESSYVRSSDAEAMTEGAEPAYPSQPTYLTKDVSHVQQSRLASEIRILAKSSSPRKTITIPTDQQDEGDEPPPIPSKSTASVRGVAPTPVTAGAPVSHIVNASGAFLVDFNYGKGQIALLSDPYIVSNAGISRADNLQLAINLIGGRKGIIAFDEFHHGQIRTENDLVAYFRGTPVLVLFGQLCLVVLAMLWTGGKRFGRPLSLPAVDRRSSLEFVSSMAELQQRARAFDLAVENIYARFRRVLVRYSGSTFDLPRKEIAIRVGERAGIDPMVVGKLMRDCEEVINGKGLDDKGAVDLIRRVRDLEKALGAGARQRDVRQEFQN